MIRPALERGRILLRSSFVRNVSGMMAFTALGQSMYLLTGPLIGRLFSPAEFGLYGLFYTFAGTAVTLACLNYDFAIPAARNDIEAKNLTVGAGVLAIFLCPLMGMVLAALAYSGRFGFAGLPAWSGALLTGILLLQVAVQLLQNWRIRENRTITIGAASVTLNVTRGITQILMGFFMPRWWALAAGELIGRIGNTAHLWKRSSRSGSRKEATVFSRASVMETMRQYRQFPVVLLPAQVIDGGIIFLQTAGLAYMFGAAGLGMFFLMRRTLDMPVAFVFRSLSDVFYARLAEDARDRPEHIRPFFIRSVLLIAAAGFVVGIPFMIFSPGIFSLIFGSAWREAGVLAAIMAPASIMNLAVAPVTRIFALTSRPHLRFWFSAVNFAGTIAALGIMSYFKLDLVYATLCLSVVTFGSYVAYFFAGYAASATIRLTDDRGGAVEKPTGCIA